MPDSAQRDYYDVLGIARDADAKAIKDAFRTLALKYHPDRNKEPGAEARFKEIAEAYAILSDPEKRKEYDTHGHAGVAGFSPEDLYGGINFDDLFGGLGFDFTGGFGGGLFDHFFRRRPTGSARGADLEIVLEIPLERVVNGGEETLVFPCTSVCHTCQGTGATPGTTPRSCKTCNGSGKKDLHRREGGVVFHQISVCADCHGRGAIIDTPCASCAGQGNVERTETLTVKIPVGAEEGMALRVPGYGLPGKDKNSPSGDLFVIVRTRTDPRFERHGADLWQRVSVEIPDAVLGTTLEVPTLEKPVTVTIPAGTQPEAVLRLRGKGLPEFGGQGRGDLYLKLQVFIPERLSREQRRLYQELQQLMHRASPD